MPRLENDLQQIYGIDAFERVDYRLDEGAQGTDLAIEAREKSWGPAYLRFGLNLEENFENTSDYNLAFNFDGAPDRSARRRVAQRPDRRQHASAASRSSGSPSTSESRYFVAPSFEFRRERFPIYDGDDRTGEFLVRQTNFGLDLGRQLSNWGELRLGVVYDFGHARTVVGTPDQAESFRAGGAFARFAVDTLDGVHFPARRELRPHLLRLRAEVPRRGRLLRHLVRQASATPSRTATIRSARSGRAEHSGMRAPPGNLAVLGGFLQLSGLDRFQLAGQNSAFGRIMAYRRVAMPGALSFQYPIYAGLSAEGGQRLAERATSSSTTSSRRAAAFVGMETPLGPIYFGYGYAEGGRDSFYLYLGQTF